ncbi:MAG: ribosome biogenesis GTP-binding protein YihA/YsxC [Bacteroidales bacterium]|jgi:GTP-binding protein|nr:ribosome biogenesis GTP-binding protein YihA/YsxC [Bacteroidales bacterium]
MRIKEAVFSGSSLRVDRRPLPRLPEFAFIGRSNVGKSSLINLLAGYGNLAKTSSTPGKTQLVNHFLINGEWYLVDLPGYGYAKVSKKSQESIKRIVWDYISNSDEMMLLFVLLDARHELQKIDEDFIYMLGEEGIPFSIVFTKCDKLSSGKLALQSSNVKGKLLEQWEELPPVFYSSAHSRTGREEILDYIDSIFKTIKH